MKNVSKKNIKRTREGASIIVSSVKFVVRRSPNKTASKSILISNKGIIDTPNPTIPNVNIFITDALFLFLLNEGNSERRAPITPPIKPPTKGCRPSAVEIISPGKIVNEIKLAFHNFFL